MEVVVEMVGAKMGWEAGGRREREREARAQAALLQSRR